MQSFISRFNRHQFDTPMSLSFTCQTSFTETENPNAYANTNCTHILMAVVREQNY